jgi:hypothetical protein
VNTTGTPARRLPEASLITALIETAEASGPLSPAPMLVVVVPATVSAVAPPVTVTVETVTVP